MAKSQKKTTKSSAKPAATKKRKRTKVSPYKRALRRSLARLNDPPRTEPQDSTQNDND